MLVYQRTHHFLQCHLVGVNGVLSSEDTNKHGKKKKKKKKTIKKKKKKKHGRNQTLNKLAHHLWLGTGGTGIYSALISFYTNHFIISEFRWTGVFFLHRIQCYSLTKILEAVVYRKNAGKRAGFIDPHKI